MSRENFDKLGEECGVFGIYDFDGHTTVADNYGKEYKQKIVGPDGKAKTFSLPVTKANSAM